MATPIGGHKDPLEKDEVSRINVFNENLLHIIHALVDGLGRLHIENWTHTDLHLANILLDCVGSSRCQVCIIDWGMDMDAFESRKAFRHMKKLDLETKEQYEEHVHKKEDEHPFPM